jgi:hypothetical protein
LLWYFYLLWQWLDMYYIYLFRHFLIAITVVYFQDKPAVMGTGMTDMGMGMVTDINICILIRTRSTLIRVPAGYTHTHDHHYWRATHSLDVFPISLLVKFIFISYNITFFSFIICQVSIIYCKKCHIHTASITKVNFHNNLT